jgi:hypothetical protein
MKPALRRFGHGQHPVVVIDDFSGHVDAIVEIAAALAPFPQNGDSFFPGLRRYITQEDQAAFAYATAVLQNAGRFIGGAFDHDSFDWVEASFSMVATAPDALTPPQRAPHFDSSDPADLAVLHYLCDTEGTAFYRHRQTGIEQVNDANSAEFIQQARPAALAAQGYIHDSDQDYERIGHVEGVRDRLVIYRGSLLHSGIIPPGKPLSTDPRVGRLTANLFVYGR